MQKLSSIQLKNTIIKDIFWNRYINLVADVIIPYQWDILNDTISDVETSHSLANFKIAAGREKGDFYGVVFQDTDVAKWLEAVAFSLSTKPNPELEKTADEVIDIIGEAQQPDGYINTYFSICKPELRWTNLQEGHELYTAGHLMEAAVAYYGATGKDKFLKIVCSFADLICSRFSKGKVEGYPGHQEVEIGLFKLYKATGEQRYLVQAKEFLDRRGQKPNYFLEEEKKDSFIRIFSEFNNYDLKYSQSHLPVREQTTAEGHAVRATYMYCAMADIASECDDKKMLEACIAIWNNIVEKRMYITGSIGSSGLLERFTADYDLPNNSNYSETCASIGLALFGRRMACITKDSRYIDVVERVLYNTLLAGTAMDGKSFFYVNPLEVWPDNCLPRTSKEHVKPIRQKWFGVSCCPPNIARTLAALGEYIYFTDESSIWINLFIASETNVTIDYKDVKVKLITNFPNDGEVRILIDNEQGAVGKLAVRIPEYVAKYRILVDDMPIEQPIIQMGYLFLDISEPKTDIGLEFDIPVKIIRANPFVREDTGKIAVVKGPLVYCLEEVDNGDNLPAIYIDTKQPLIESYQNELLGGAVVIKGKGKRISQRFWKQEELYQEKELSFEDIELTFVPYAYWGNRITGEMLVWIKELLK